LGRAEGIPETLAELVEVRILRPHSPLRLVLEAGAPDRGVNLVRAPSTPGCQERQAALDAVATQHLVHVEDHGLDRAPRRPSTASQSSRFSTCLKIVECSEAYRAESRPGNGSAREQPEPRLPWVGVAGQRSRAQRSRLWHPVLVGRPTRPRGGRSDLMD